MGWREPGLASDHFVPRCGEAGQVNCQDCPQAYLWGVRASSEDSLWGRRSQMMNWLSQKASAQGEGNFKHSVSSITWISPTRSSREAVNKTPECYLNGLSSREWHLGTGSWCGAGLRERSTSCPSGQSIPGREHMTCPWGASQNFQKHVYKGLGPCVKRGGQQVSVIWVTTPVTSLPKDRWGLGKFRLLILGKKKSRRQEGKNG